MTKKEALRPPGEMVMFEEVLSGGVLVQDSNDWRECRYAFHVKWFDGMLKAGFVESAGIHLAWPDGPPSGSGRPQFNYQKLHATEKGIRWWVNQTLGELKDRDAAYRDLVESGQQNLEGNGIGAEMRFTLSWRPNPAVLAGIQDGYFEFVEFYSFRFERAVTVRLTEAGYRYFSSIPRLELECA